MKYRLCLALMFSFFSTSSFADWALNPTSSLSFISVKADQIGETHHFSKLSGSVSSEGAAQIVIDLSSVETNIPIRNERMLEFLFKVAQFPSATITSTVDAKSYQSLKRGERVVATLPFSLNLHGKTAELNATVEITKLSKKQISVVSQTPVIVSAGTFELTAGIDKLQSLAGLSSISKAVPVSFSLIFDL